MLIYILKFSACLLAFISFYKVFLEQTSYNKFKRYYLISALLAAIIIPVITFVQYIEPQFILGDFTAFPILTEASQEILPIKEPTNYLTLVLWSIYGLGVLIFSVKFSRNLIKIIQKIKGNPKYKTSNFINVLLKDSVVPHTFLSYIFLNKVKFENKEIPREVLLHEETHAQQKHSLDVLLIEVLQIVFWFNPLMYLVKKDMKLNHEFLADQAVIQQGIQPVKYQELLLAFSSNATDPQLANAINYSSIKKRLTVMKTQTKKRTLWFRSLVLVPLLALLVYSFSSRELVEKEIESNISIEDATLLNNKFKNEKHTARSIDIEVLDGGNFIVDGVKATKETLTAVINTLHQDITPETRNRIMNIHVNSLNKISNEDVWFIYNSLLDYGFHRMVTDNQEIILSKGNTPYAIEGKSQESLKNPIAKNSRLIPSINGISCDNCTVNLSRNGIKSLILGTTTNEKISNFKIKFPKKPAITINSNKLNQQAIAYLKDAKIGNAITIFDIMSNRTVIESSINIQLVIKHDEKYSNSPIIKKGEVSNIPPPAPKGTVLKGEASNIPPPPPPPIPANATPEQKKKYQKITDEYKRKYKLVKGEVSNIPPPPPPPKEPLDHVIDMAKKGAIFYLNEKKVTSDQAIDALKKNKSLNVQTIGHSTKQPTVYIQTKPIHIKNKKGLPKPTAENSLDHIKIMNGHNAKFYLNNTKITYREALAYVKKNRNANISTSMESNVVIIDKKEKQLKNQETRSPKTGFINVNGKKLYYTNVNSKITYYNRYGVVTDKTGKELQPNKQTNASDVLPNSRISKVYQNDQVVSEFKNSDSENFISPPPKDIPSMLKLANKGALFYFEGKEISGKKAIELTDNNKTLNILIRDIDSKKPIVKLSKEPIRI